MPYPNDRERCACGCSESIEGRADIVEFRGEVYIDGHEPTSHQQARLDAGFGPEEWI